MCGSSPADITDDSGFAKCSECNEKYSQWPCDRCGTPVHVLRGSRDDTGRCCSCEAQDLWQSLPEDVQQAVDAAVLQDRRINALLPMVEERPGREAISLSSAQDILANRYTALAAEITYQPERGPDLAGLIERVEQLEHPVAAIEATWDGDTQGWFVRLWAILATATLTGPRYEEVSVGFYSRRAGDMRLFDGQVPPWPEAQDAVDDGEALAARFGVPFYFVGRDRPDLDYPRWWEGEAARGDPSTTT